MQFRQNGTEIQELIPYISFSFFQSNCMSVPHFWGETQGPLLILVAIVHSTSDTEGHQCQVIPIL